MDILICDIETNGLLESKIEDGKPTKVMDKVHCIVARDNAGKVLAFHDAAEIKPRTGSIADGLRRLSTADVLVGHNLQSFDVRALQHVYPHFKPKARLSDTLIQSRLIWPEIKEKDLITVRKGGTFPLRLVGRHKLEAWGHRLGVYKGDFAEATDWQTFDQAMLDYCIQDTLVTATLFDKIARLQYSPESVQLEHDFVRILDRQERKGVLFDVLAAEKLIATLMARRNELDEQLRTMVEPFVDHYKTPVKKIEKTRTTQFNPQSRDHVARHLQERRGWKPTEFTEGGAKPRIDEDILSPMTWPEAVLLNERFLIQKRLGQIAEGKQGWLKVADAFGRIHGRVNHNGAVTGRCTHSSPNLSAVPKVKLGKDGVVLRGGAGAFGWECRALFIALAGYLLVGADAKALELCCLAHFMARHDGGAYAKILLEGDIHEVNRLAAGLDTRDQAKTFIYAFLYGAGDEKIGSIVGKGAQAGRALKTAFLKRLPALAAVRDGVIRAVKQNGHLRGLDGRVLTVRSQHSALNTLLQSAGAVVMKKATVLLDRKLYVERGYSETDVCQVLHIHDEFQFEAREAIAQQVGQDAVASIQEAGRHFKFRCPLDGAFKVGKSWAETH